MEKEYTVVVHKGVDLTELEYEITASSGAGPIPNRSVDIANPRPASKRQTHFMLTDEEATALEADTRVLAVEIPPDQRTDIQIGFNSTQLGNFTKPITFDNNTYVNWGLRRSIMETNSYGSGGTSDNTFPYALTGKGVDVVIQDSGIEPNHPDFIDSNGVSRVKAIDWYTAQSVVSGTQNANYNRDFDGHGTLCASITAGNVYGFAKDAHIYSMKIAGLEGAGDSSGTAISDCFDVIKEWHNAKTNGRPTVVNMSWGYSSTVTGDPTSGTYRGTGWVWGVDYTTDLTLWQGTGVVIPLAGTTRKIPARTSSVDADVDELIAAGVHVVIAAGNDYYAGDVSTGTDYNNNIIFGGLTFNYGRGSSPHSDDAFMVGNISTSVYNDSGVYKDRTQGSSSRGPRVNIWAPGTNIVGATSTTNSYTSLDSPVDANYKIVSLSGTSFAAPQVAGVTALHLQVTPQSTPLQLKTKLLAEAKPVMYDTASDTDYTQFNTSLLGASTKVLFDKYGRQPVEVSGQNLTLQRATPTTT
jgi:subtilisin family serine protease